MEPAWVSSPPRARVGVKKPAPFSPGFFANCPLPDFPNTAAVRKGSRADSCRASGDRLKRGGIWTFGHWTAGKRHGYEAFIPFGALKRARALAILLDGHGLRHIATLALVRGSMALRIEDYAI